MTVCLRLEEFDATAVALHGPRKEIDASRLPCHADGLPDCTFVNVSALQIKKMDDSLADGCIVGNADEDFLRNRVVSDAVVHVALQQSDGIFVGKWVAFCQIPLASCLADVVSIVCPRDDGVAIV